MSEILESVDKLTKDMRQAAVKMSRDEARFLVDAYYQMQDDRIRGNNQVRSMIDSGEPNDVLRWLSAQSSILEDNIKRALDRYTDAHLVGRWSRSVCGIGPIISAGLLAHIDISRVKTAGQIWRFAGQDPTSVWNKGERRPWNARLKTLCWKIGESFVKVQNRDSDFYGKLYAARKVIEIARNDNGDFKSQAEAKLTKFKIGKDTDAYKAYIQGKLPPAHLHARARRYAVKIFLAHYFEVAYFDHNKERAPLPYVIAHLGHVDQIQVPGWPF